MYCRFRTTHLRPVWPSVLTPSPHFEGALATVCPEFHLRQGEYYDDMWEIQKGPAESPERGSWPGQVRRRLLWCYLNEPQPRALTVLTYTPVRRNAPRCRWLTVSCCRPIMHRQTAIRIALDSCSAVQAQVILLKTLPIVIPRQAAREACGVLKPRRPVETKCIRTLIVTEEERCFS